MLACFRNQSAPTLPTSFVDEVIRSLRDNLNFQAVDHTEPPDSQFRTVLVTHPETSLLPNLSGGMVPLRPPVARGINGSFRVDDIKMSARDNARFSNALEARMLEVATEKALAIKEFLAERLTLEYDTSRYTYVRNGRPYDPAEHGDAIQKILSSGTQLSLDNRYGEIPLPLNECFLSRLKTSAAEFIGAAGLLGIANIKTECYMITNGTFYLYGRSPLLGGFGTATVVIAVPPPRSNREPFFIKERLKPLVTLTSKKDSNVSRIARLLMEACKTQALENQR